MRGALGRFFPQAPCSLFANDPVGDIDSTYESPSRGLASRGPASPGERDHLEPLPLNSWVCTAHHHHPGTTQPQKGYPLRSAGPPGVDQPGFRLFHLRGESCSLMEARFIVGSLARCFLLASGGTRALALQPLVASHVRFILLDRLIHLMRCQGTLPRNFRIQHVPISCRTPFKETSYWRDSNSACESWPCQSLSRLLTEVPTLIMKS